MNLNRIVLPLVLALIATLTTTGCRYNFDYKTTELPHPATTSKPTPPPDLNTKPISQPENNPTTTSTPAPYVTGPIATSTNWGHLANMNIDREKLAAYAVHFNFDSAVVLDREQANVTSVAGALKADANAELLIEGNCDERGTGEYNRALGERRALALREALAKIGVDAARVRTISYGKDQPVDRGHDEAAWAKNRRGQFDWCAPKSPVP
jgi:peptidoglycan-associated lipoprotein